MQEEKEEQRPGRNKETTVDKSYLSSGEYRKKFDKLYDSKKLNRLIYQLAKEMLIHRSGTVFEDMYWIDPESCTVIAKVTDSEVEEKIIYPESVRKTISRYKGLLTIHSHPSGLPPSISDFNANYENDYSMGIVVGHNGKVYAYRSNEIINKSYFNQKVARYSQNGYNEGEAIEMAVNYCKEHFSIEYKEVTADE